LEKNFHALKKGIKRWGIDGTKRAKNVSTEQA